MSRALRLPSWLSPPQAEAAIEIAAGRVTVAQFARSGKPSVTGFASEALPADAVTPALAAKNIANPRAVSDAVKRALEHAGIKTPSRVSLVLPDSAARITLVALEQLPKKAADLEQLIRWQVKKATPFPIEEAAVSYVTASVDGSVTTLAAVVAHRGVVAEYEAIADAIGAHAGLVDVASLNVINTAIAAGVAPNTDWLLVCLAGEATTIAIMRGDALLFHRHRAAGDNEPLASLVHQTSMYYEDRLAGTRFSKVFLTGGGPERHEKAKREISDRLFVPISTLDPRTAAALVAGPDAPPDVLDAMAAPVGILLRERGAA